MRRRRTTRNGLSRRRNRSNPIPLLLFISVLGFFLWAIFQLFVFLFSNIQSESSSAEIKILKGRAEFLLPESLNWSPAFSEQKLWPDETIRTGTNSKASLNIFQNNILFLGPETEIKVIVLEENSSQKKKIKLQLKKGNIWVKAADDDFKDKSSSFEIESPRLSLSITGTVFDLSHSDTEDVIRLVKGSLNVSPSTTTETPSTLSMGVGQKLVTKAETSLSEDQLTAIDPEFIESDWHTQNLGEFFPLEAKEIQQRLNKNNKNNEEADPLANPLATDGSTDVESPQIISPQNGIKIPASEQRVAIEGTASLDTFQIEINGFALTKFTPGDKKWTYYAATKFGTLFSGENKFSVVAISRDGKRSIPTTLTITYEGASITKTPPPTTPPETKSPTTENFPTPIITSPKVASIETIHQTAAAVITIRGEVNNQTQAVEVNGFRLQKFKPGNTTFSYIANAGYGNMKKGLNTYEITAIGNNDASSSTKVLIEYTPISID